MRCILLVCSFIVTVSCFAQQNYSAANNLKSEFGVHVAAYNLPAFGDRYGRIGSVNSNLNTLEFLNGISYKRYLKNHIFRASFTYRNLAGSSKFAAFNSESYYNESILKTGYERDLGKRNLKPFLAADIGIYYVNFNRLGFNPTSRTNYKLSGFGGCISPVFGLKYKLTQSLSLQAESCLDLAYFGYSHRESTTRFPVGAKFRTQRFHAAFNPLQKLSLNIKF